MMSVLNKRFGRLTLVAFDSIDKHFGKKFVFKCDCGNTKSILFNNVRRGKSKSCGCGEKENLAYWQKKLGVMRRGVCL